MRQECPCSTASIFQERCNFGAENSVVHHKNIKLGNVVNDKFLEVFLVLAAVLVSSLGTVTNGGHKSLALESTADTGVNTLKTFYEKKISKLIFLLKIMTFWKIPLAFSMTDRHGRIGQTGDE